MLYNAFILNVYNSSCQSRYKWPRPRVGCVYKKTRLTDVLNIAFAPRQYAFNIVGTLGQGAISQLTVSLEHSCCSAFW